MASVPADRLGLLDHVLRLGSRYRLMVLDRLSPDELEALGAIGEAPDVYGVLRPVADGTFKAVDRDLALLLLTLREPSPLPLFFRRDRPASELRRQIVGLIADEVLDIAIDGEYRSGAAALAALGETIVPNGETELAQQSLEALRYASTLGLSEPRALAERLYAFGSLPVSPYWRRTLSSPDAVLDAVGHPRLPAYRRSGPSRDHPWISWSHKWSADTVARGRPSYKLYVSPPPEALRHVFEVLPEALVRHDVRQFKLGATAHGLLRPDKLVLYFAEHDGLAETARWLADRLDGLPVQGVPFTSQIAARGLLSWGMDPSVDHALFGGFGRGSWRSLLTERLAVALLDAERSAEVMEPWSWAMNRVRLDGVDIESWTPQPS